MPRRLFMGDERPMDEDNPFALGGGTLGLISNIAEDGTLINIPVGGDYAFEKGAAAFSGLGLATDPDFWTKSIAMFGKKPTPPAGKRPASRSPIVTRGKAKKPATVTPDGPYTSANPRSGIPLPSLANMPEKKKGAPFYQNPAATAGTDGEEVPVAKVPRLLPKVIPNHFTVNLPHEYSAFFDPLTFTETNSTPMIRIRLNSIYDPIVGAASNTQPQGRDLWTGYFKYYRVLASHVTCTLMSAAVGEENNNAAFHSFLWGFELADQDQTICTNRQGFLMTKHAKRELLPVCLTNYVWNGTIMLEKCAKPSMSTVSYSYNPNDWHYHVREQGSEERWTPIAQNPSVDHDLVLRAFHLTSTAPIADGQGFFLMVSINYTVQFMEEKEENYKVRDTSVATYGGTGEDPTDD